MKTLVEMKTDRLAKEDLTKGLRSHRFVASRQF
jgi:hypothetical protein